jgi:hypothetical protein
LPAKGDRNGRRVHPDMEKWNEIRHRVLVEGASKRSIRRDYGIAQAALDKILALTEPPGYVQRVERPKSKFGPFMGWSTRSWKTTSKLPPSSATPPGGSSIA